MTSKDKTAEQQPDELLEQTENGAEVATEELQDNGTDEQVADNQSAIDELQQQLDEAKVALDKDTKNEELAFKYHELERKIQIEMMKLSQPKGTGNE